MRKINILLFIMIITSMILFVKPESIKAVPLLDSYTETFEYSYIGQTLVSNPFFSVKDNAPNAYLTEVVGSDSSETFFDTIQDDRAFTIGTSPTGSMLSYLDSSATSRVGEAKITMKNDSFVDYIDFNIVLSGRIQVSSTYNTKIRFYSGTGLMTELDWYYDGTYGIGNTKWGNLIHGGIVANLTDFYNNALWGGVSAFNLQLQLVSSNSTMHFTVTDRVDNDVYEFWDTTHTNYGNLSYVIVRYEQTTCNAMIDNVRIGFDDAVAPEIISSGNMYFNFYDAVTGRKLAFNDLAGSYRTDNYLVGRIYLTQLYSGVSFTTELDYSKHQFLSSEAVSGTMPLLNNYTGVINVTGSTYSEIYGMVDGTNVVWKKYSKSDIIYDGQTYNVYLKRVNQYDMGEKPSDYETYNTTFGDFWIQFYNYDESCYYFAGDSTDNILPIIIYNLNDSLFGGGDGYLWEIYKIGVSTPVFTGKITFYSGSVQGITFPTSYFTSTGEYEIRLFNLTSDLEKDTLVYTSLRITVCDNDIDKIDYFNFDDIPTFFKVIVALFIIIVITICPYFFAVFIGRGTSNHIEIPSLVYVAFFFFGIAISIMLNLLEAWVFFIIFFGLIITLAIFWIKGKSDSGGD